MISALIAIKRYFDKEDQRILNEIRESKKQIDESFKRSLDNLKECIK